MCWKNFFYLHNNFEKPNLLFIDKPPLGTLQKRPDFPVPCRDVTTFFCSVECKWQCSGKFACNWKKYFSENTKDCAILRKCDLFVHSLSSVYITALCMTFIPLPLCIFFNTWRYEKLIENGLPVISGHQIYVSRFGNSSAVLSKNEHCCTSTYIYQNKIEGQKCWTLSNFKRYFSLSTRKIPTQEFFLLLTSKGRLPMNK